MRIFLLLLAAVGCTGFLSAQTTPSVSFTFTVDPNTTKVTFINTSKNLGEGSKKAFWNFGDGSRSATKPAEGAVHTYATAGSYQACLSIYRYPTNSHDSILVGSSCRTVIVQRTCSAGFEWVTAGGGAVRFSASTPGNAGSIKQVCWKFGDATDTCINVPAGTSPAAALKVTHAYKEGGVYNACLRVVFDGGCVAEKCGLVSVPKTQPAADSCAAGFAVHSINDAPLSRRFLAKPWSKGQKKPVRICWTFGDGKDTCMEYSAGYSGDYWAEHKYAQNGRYEACVSIRYESGCESKRCEVVQIATPVPACEVSLNEVARELASPERRFYVGLQQNKPAKEICWRFGDGTDTCVSLSDPLRPEQLTMSHRYAAPGSYNLCIRVVYAGGCVAERCREVEIRLPGQGLCGGYFTDSVVSANTFRFAATSIQGPGDAVTGYLWTFGDGKSATQRQVTHTYAAPGSYTVCVNMKTAAGCETHICKRLAVAGNARPQLALSPNPVVGTLTAVFQSLLQQAVSVRIYNGNGVLVKNYSRNAVAGTNTWTFDLAGLQAGVYSMVVQSPNQFATAIFFKQ